MRRLFLYPIIFCFVFLGFNPAGAKPAKDAEGLKEYLEIFRKTLAQKSVKEMVEIVYPEMIRDYKSFIKKYPNSLLVADSKMRIVEFYNLTGAQPGEKKMYKEIVEKMRKAGNAKYSQFEVRFNDNWRPAAVEWLKDIVRNHPWDKVVDPNARSEKGELIAAFALYYLYEWDVVFRAENSRVIKIKNKEYLKTLIQNYPESLAAKWAGDILKARKIKIK